MVVRKSEYQKQYKACIIKKNEGAYLENLNLRHQRRDREFLHTPICWENSSDEDEKTSSGCSEEEQSKPKIQPHKEPEYQSLAEILSDSKKKAESARRQAFLEGFKRPSDNANGITGEEKQLINADVLTKLNMEEKKQNETGSLNNTTKNESVAVKSNVVNDPVADENRRSNKADLTRAAELDRNNRDVSEYRSCVVGGLLKEDIKLPAVNQKIKKERKRSKEPEGFKKIKPSSALDRRCYSSRLSSVTEGSYVPQLLYTPRARKPHQSHIPRTKSTPVSPETPLKERPLFLAYGAGDKEDSLTTHRTHNVRAPVDVYPSALRAKVRRQEEHRRQADKIHKAASTETMLEKLCAPAADLAGWESEYRKQFHGYQPRDYEKAVSSHAVIPRSSSVRAVHRGGCLLVHVD
ncbi:unnamed protein product [Candidula unifasciata]|uniref:Uncharacterized protein n=1 Tax=Candidula unifasciata TaxID=100452 RepID=A0A8S3YSF3_9EUPU|nr:unnamed protein product [Candidula unifasciata]